MASGGPRATDTQCPFRSSCRKKRHLQAQIQGLRSEIRDSHVGSNWFVPVRCSQAQPGDLRIILTSTSNIASSFCKCQQSDNLLLHVPSCSPGLFNAVNLQVRCGGGGAHAWQDLHLCPAQVELQAIAPDLHQSLRSEWTQCHKHTLRAAFIR